MPIDPDAIAHELEAASTEELARSLRHQIAPMRGLRGTPAGTVARIAAAAWRSTPPKLPRDEDLLTSLFAQAWEDGLVAVGLLAACVPDNAGEALDIGLGWLDRVDDVQTADALGWMVLGPAALASRAPLGTILADMAERPHAAVRRAGVSMGLAMTTLRLEGPSAAPLRARLGEKEIRFVDAALSDRLALVGEAFVRDDDPLIRKGLRRVLGAWAEDAPDEALDWFRNVRGGAHKMLREEVEKSARKGRRRMERALEAGDEEEGGDVG